MIKPYERLSTVYDPGWSDFSKQYIDLISELLTERGITQARILDIACGTGTLAVELAKCGHVVHGIDSSREMIRIARSKATGLSNITFDIQDMVQFSIDRTFDLVTCTFDSINYIRKMNHLRELFFRIASVLHKGGLFIFYND